MNSKILVFLVFLKVAMATESCPSGQFYFNNSTSIPSESNVTTESIPVNCHNCSLHIENCDHCYYNHTQVVCHNCTYGWRLNGNACFKEEKISPDSFQWWGGLLIALAIIGAAAGSVAGYWWWKNRDNEIDLPNPLPNPDGKEGSFKILNDGKKKKKNSYTKDPTRSAQRIQASVYDQNQPAEGIFSNSLFSEVVNITEQGASHDQEHGADPLYVNVTDKVVNLRSKAISQYPDIYANT